MTERGVAVTDAMLNELRARGVVDVRRQTKPTRPCLPWACCARVAVVLGAFPESASTVHRVNKRWRGTDGGGVMHNEINNNPVLGAIARAADVTIEAACGEPNRYYELTGDYAASLGGVPCGQCFPDSTLIDRRVR